jgi:hypothetical protein
MEPIQNIEQRISVGNIRQGITAIELDESRRIIASMQASRCCLGQVVQPAENLGITGEPLARQIILATQGRLLLERNKN